MKSRVCPAATWERIAPAEAGFDPAKLDKVRMWLDEHSGPQGYRFVVVRGGRIVVEWNRNVPRDRLLPIASAAKSIYSNVLGIVVAEGRLPSADARVVDFFPEMMDVPEGQGPKPGRHAFEKDRRITFRQLISNTSGYMKPGEEPGRVFHYQTFGMNVPAHAPAKLYGLYDVNNPEGLPGFGALIEEKIAKPIGAQWGYSLTNFQHPPGARTGVFGFYCQVHTNALDFARVGWLWCNRGRWGGRQIVPENWMRESTRTNPDIMARGPETERKYGYGFWVNDQGKLWPDLPRDGFTASGAGGHYASVFPSLDLVVVQNPGPYRSPRSGQAARANPELLKLVLDAGER